MSDCILNKNIINRLNKFTAYLFGSFLCGLFQMPLNQGIYLSEDTQRRTSRPPHTSAFVRQSMGGGSTQNWPTHATAKKTLVSVGTEGPGQEGLAPPFGCLHLSELKPLHRTVQGCPVRFCIHFHLNSEKFTFFGLIYDSLLPLF